ncbi:MAG: hypothetical protein DRP01_08165 [Archaeoglobales archaeon]|nr:MAG: hypothetical protein DRP01_08165 [Archaeoglobales archaeon]
MAVQKAQVWQAPDHLVTAHCGDNTRSIIHVGEIAVQGSGEDDAGGYRCAVIGVAHTHCSVAPWWPAEERSVEGSYSIHIRGRRPTVGGVAVALVTGEDIGLGRLAGAEDHRIGEHVPIAVHQRVVEIAAVGPVGVHPGQDGVAGAIGGHGDVGIASDGGRVAQRDRPGNEVIGVVQHDEAHTATPGDNDVAAGELHRVGVPAPGSRGRL